MMRRCFPAFLALTVTAALVGCGDKTEAPQRSGSSAAAPAKFNPKSMAGQEGNYTDFVMTNSMTRPQWLSYVNTYGRLAAAVPGISDKDLGTAAFPELAAEPDPFKREEKFNEKKDALKALRQEAMPRIRLVRYAGASIGPYDMAAETYFVQFEELLNAERFYYWEEGSGVAMERALLTKVPTDELYESGGNFRITVKVPKDKARQIEAAVAKHRGADGVAPLSMGTFVSVQALQQPGPNKTVIVFHVDGVALFVRDPNSNEILSQETLLLVDGPDFKNRTVN